MSSAFRKVPNVQSGWHLIVLKGYYLENGNALEPFTIIRAECIRMLCTRAHTSEITLSRLTPPQSKHVCTPSNFVVVVAISNNPVRV